MIKTDGTLMANLAVELCSWVLYGSPPEYYQAKSTYQS